MKPLEILNQWMRAVNSGDVEMLLSLYGSKAVLIPTFSNRILDTPDKIRDYFEKLSTREDLSIALHEKTVSVVEYDGKYCSVNGIYNWRFKVDGEILNFEARFSYLLDAAASNPIIHHHSSQVPRML